MIFSSKRSNYFDKHMSEHISYVIRQCVHCNTPVSLRDIQIFDSHYIYLFETSSLPPFTLLNMLSNYFDSMSIGVNKEQCFIKLTLDFNKGIPF